MPAQINKKSMFRNAASHLEAAFALQHAIRQRQQFMPLDEAMKLLEPMTVCEGLATELFLKLLLHITGGNFTRIHGLHGLYKALALKHQEALGRHYEALLTATPQLSGQFRQGPDGRRSLEHVLRQSNDIFVQVRYWHEKLPTDMNAVWPAAVALQTYLVELDPDLPNTHG